MPTLQRPTVELHYTARGQGPAVVFIHGWCDDACTWEPVVDALAADHRCLALDLRGHGSSGRPFDHDYSIEATSNDIAALVAREQADGAILVGHSYGAIIAAAVAARHAALARALLLIDQSYDLAGMQGQLLAGAPVIRSEEQHLGFRREFLGALIGAVPQVHRSRLEAAIATTSADVALAMWAPLFEWTSAELTAFVDRILAPLDRVPTTVLDRERLTPYHDDLARRFPRARVDILAGSHWLHLEHATRIASEIRALAAR